MRNSFTFGLQKKSSPNISLSQEIQLQPPSYSMETEKFDSEILKKTDPEDLNFNGFGFHFAHSFHLGFSLKICNNFYQDRHWISGNVLELRTLDVCGD
jgi:hypothetical protein